MEIWRLAVIFLAIILLIVNGSKVVYKDNFAIVTGIIQMPEAGSDLVSAGTTVNYPEGYTKDNSVVISLMGHNERSGSVNNWFTPIGVNSISVVSGTGNLYARCGEDGINVSSEKMSTSQSRSDVTFRLVLMKIQ